MRSTKLVQTQKSLEQVEKIANGTMGRAEEVERRLVSLDGRATALEEIDQKIATLLSTVQSAQQAADDVAGPNSALEQHRRAVEALCAETTGAQSDLETLRHDRRSLDDLRQQVRETQSDLKQSLTQAANLKNDVEQVRSAAALLSDEYTRMRDLSRDTRGDSEAAMQSVAELETRLAPLAQLHDLTKNTEERLTAVNALSEHVAHKIKALESQKHAVDRAVVEANRLNELVWAMDEKIAKLNDGHAQLAKTEEQLARIEKLAGDTTTQVEAATKVKEGWSREIARIEKDGRAMGESIRSHVERLSVEKKDLEAFDQRLRVCRRQWAARRSAWMRSPPGTSGWRSSAPASNRSTNDSATCLRWATRSNRSTAPWRACTRVCSRSMCCRPAPNLSLPA